MFGKRLIKSNDGGGGASFNTVTYTGNGSTQSVSGVGFQPDMVWVKGRTVAYDHGLVDSVRGTDSLLYPNVSQAESTVTNAMQSFDSNGFTWGSNNKGNASDSTYVAWCWKAGGAAVTNTDGSISSDVSANVDAGFSIVKYTGNGTSGTTVGHGLSVAPDIVITKGIDFGDGWLTTGAAIGNNDTNYFLFTTGAEGSSYTVGASYATTINIGTSTSSNTNNKNFISYCFHSVAGFSKIGSYSGNNSATGPTVTTDFEPAFVMIKRTDSTGNWVILDNKRDTSNPIDKTLNPNLSAVESTANDIDFNATTFQLKSTNADTNASGTDNYIYMAFANQF